jgi:hypothetical protein
MPAAPNILRRHPDFDLAPIREIRRDGALVGEIFRDGMGRPPALPRPTTPPRRTFDRHYVYHTAWAARVLSRLTPQPARHVDIASSLYFAAIASAFLPVAHYDLPPPRPHSLKTSPAPAPT